MEEDGHNAQPRQNRRCFTQWEEMERNLAIEKQRCRDILRKHLEFQAFRESLKQNDEINFVNFIDL